MSKLHLTDSKFFNWRGWDFLKWLFGAVILAGVLWIILIKSLS